MLGEGAERIKSAEEKLRKKMHDLGERVKELNCLYGISKLAAKADISPEEILQGVVDLIPPSWQYPEVTCARVVLEDREFRTENFQETIWKQSSYIIVHGEQYGVLDVFYLEERPSEDEGPFLSEERSLIDAIAARLGKTIERNQAEEALLKSEKRFRDLVENSLVGIFIIQDDKIVYKNPELERLFGPLPKSFRLASFKGIHADDVKKVKEFFQNIASGEHPSLDTDFRFSPVRTIDNRLDMKWVYCRASLIEYEGKDAILINMMDMTRAKELENLLRIQDRMTSLGHVAAGIAHEIRNPLSGINIYLNALEKIYDRGESFDKVKEIIGKVQSASAKIESVIKRVMDFSRPSETKFILTDINQPIEDAVSLSSVTLRKTRVKIEKALAEHLPPCQADPHLIEQVILNLITNASEAMKDLDRTKKIMVTSSADNDRIVVKVSDSGPGVPLHLKDRIFDPFYSSKNDSTGIGLSIAHRIITDHGGSFYVSQSRWGGAEFIFEIPVEKDTAQ